MKNKAWTVSVMAGILLVGGVVAAFFGTGLRFFVVQTPSMGTVAPVGTLVVARAQSEYHIGDVVTYQRDDRSYTHRIVDVTAQGFITKGDINGAADALPVPQSEIIGASVFYGKYLGFLIEGLPWIIIGWAIVYALTLLPRVRPSWRWQFRFVGWSLVVSLVALWYRPWVNMVMTGYMPVADGVEMHLVNTGIFPVNVLGTVLSSGQDAIVTQTVMDSHGKYTVTPELALTFWWFLLLLVICLTPMIASLFVRIDDEVVEPTGDEEATAGGEPEEDGKTEAVTRTRWYQRVPRVAWLGVVVTACVVLVAVVLQWSTHASFTAGITNNANNARVRTWLTCQGAEVGTGARFVWNLTATGVQTDLSPNGRSGTMTTNGTAATASTSSPCPRDTQGSVMFNGGTCFTQSPAVTVAQVYSLEVWFKTTNVAYNGKLMGLADTNNPGTQSHYDRHIYIDQNGRVLFGAYVASQYVVTSPAGKSYADGNWHHVVATSNATTISLYLDGALISSRSDTANQDSYAGYWQVGCGLLNQWQDASGTPQAFKSYYTGNMRLAAVYDATLTAAQVLQHYQAGIA